MKQQHLTRQQRRHIPRTGRQRRPIVRERLDRAELLLQVEQHLERLNSGTTTVDLIGTIITNWPGCPRFASLLVDRLMQGDEDLAIAIRNHES